MVFAWPWLFLALPLPWLWHVLLRPAMRSEPALRAPFFAALHNVTTQGPAIAPRPIRRQALGWLVWVLLVCAAARPQWLDEPLALPQSGRDMLLAVDISGSMEMPDFSIDGEPLTRLDVVRVTAREFIARREGDRVGLILFGSQAYLQTPLTFDRKTVQAMLDDASIGIAGKETAIGDAIGLAIKRLTDTEAHHRVLVLLTDGANTAGAMDPLKAAQLAAQAGLRIYAIGMGADELRIDMPGPFGSRLVNPSQDLDEKALQRITQVTGAKYFRARDTAGLEAIYEALDELEPATADKQTFRLVRELYVWPLGVALLISAVMALLTVWPPGRWHPAGNPSAAASRARQGARA